MFAGLAAPHDIEATVRSRLADSIAHVAERAGQRLSIDRARLDRALGRIRQTRQDPGTFARYFDLVLAVTAGDFGLASRLVEEIVERADAPIEFAIVPYDRSILGDDYERFARLLFSEFSGANPMARPTDARFATTSRALGEALEIIREVDPTIGDEIAGLVARIFIAAGKRTGPARQFGGVTSFMVWGATFINADLERTMPGMVEVLVHEVTHSLLFGLSGDEPLVLNAPEESYPAPLRTDPRPMDGIYHAALVCARIAEFNSAWLERGIADGHERACVGEVADNLAARFAESVRTIRRHGKLTGLGRDLLDRACGALSVAA